VFLIAGCGADLLINLLLTLLGYFPVSKLPYTPSNSTNADKRQGHIHAFYLEYVYVKRRDEIRAGIYDGRLAPGVYSQKVQNGGMRSGAVAAQPPVVVQPGVPAQQGYGTVH
jgi:hypothetical protein